MVEPAKQQQQRRKSSSSSSSSFEEQRQKKAVDPNSPIRIKVLSLGSRGVGKSCIIKRYCEGRFVQKYISTVGIDYGVKAVKVDGKQVRVNFWDLSGRAEFFEIRNEFYKDTQGVILVYDVSDRRSFEDLEDWLLEASRFGMSRDLPVVLCANKIDKVRRVSEEEGRAYATSRGFSYFETSANSGANIADLFDLLFEKALDYSNSVKEVF
ncbi:hypothetical protein CTAYLR_008320 [Chrysophaeum taylorii]|uniref:Uncharacterized protein n=1 Tax=Chrysophaeum taylorii TaxID=2483200 RepID=A0AAD7UB28_9STRA|nr:hypothetical protein CTAYLR_008320 [Chrysophaeum taylorii]